VPLPTPILDDRSYQQLRDELIRRIPVYTPEWTDHNASDPGVTLIELFAFLGENILYRFNQIPESTRLAFLKLLQIPLRPASPARAMITLTRTDQAGDSILVPIGSEAKAGNVSFETASEISAWPLRVIAVARAASPAPTTTDAIDFAAAAIDARGGLQASEEAVYYQNQRVPDDPAAPGAMPVNFQTAVDGALWIAVLSTKTTDVTKLKSGVINIGFMPDEEIIGIDDVDACPGDRAADVSDEMIWQVSTGIIDNGEPTYKAIVVDGDTTRGLAQQGVIRLRLPDDITTLGTYALPDADLAGTGNFPPDLEDPSDRAATLFWLRASRRSESRPLRRVLFIGVNATEVVQLRRSLPEFLGIGNGEASQTFQLVNRNVIVSSTVVQVEESGWTDWHAVDDFVASAEDQRHYVLDPEAGTIRFGNGVKGKAPQTGQRIRVTE
jgi:hypothetical protein